MSISEMQEIRNTCMCVAHISSPKCLVDYQWNHFPVEPKILRNFGSTERTLEIPAFSHKNEKNLSSIFGSTGQTLEIPGFFHLSQA
jgi:hypothetical protein